MNSRMNDTHRQDEDDEDDSTDEDEDDDEIKQEHIFSPLWFLKDVRTPHD